MRLARFNVQSASGGDKRYYVGMPSPAAAAVPAATVFIYPTPLFDYSAALPALLMVLVPAVLMVSTIKYRSFKDLKFKGHQQITYLVWGILTLMMVAAWPQVMLFVIFAGYALMGPVERLFWLVAQAMGKKGPAKTDVPSLEPKP
jgi:CDP-diacylglycerol--serine O-phosphatidyltransferase